jgi:hypothetical protein
MQIALPSKRNLKAVAARFLIAKSRAVLSTNCQSDAIGEKEAVEKRMAVL